MQRVKVNECIFRDLKLLHVVVLQIQFLQGRKIDKLVQFDLVVRKVQKREVFEKT
jgi:hypothetical protein